MKSQEMVNCSGATLRENRNTLSSIRFSLWNASTTLNLNLFVFVEQINKDPRNDLEFCHDRLQKLENCFELLFPCIERSPALHLLRILECVRLILEVFTVLERPFER